MKHICKEVAFPLTMTWEDGSKQTFQNREELECDLEDFDAEKEPNCELEDAHGYKVSIKLSLKSIERLELAVELSGHP
jgi:hypothetical protein